MGPRIPPSATSWPCSGEMDLIFDPVTLTKGGIIGLLAFGMAAVVTAFLNEWVVPGVSHRRQIAESDAERNQLRVERDEFKRLAFELSEIAVGTQRVRAKVFVGRKESS